MGTCLKPRVLIPYPPTFAEKYLLEILVELAECDTSSANVWRAEIDVLNPEILD
jgi:hypothetical protein